MKAKFNFNLFLIEKRLTVKQLAEKTGVHADTIYKSIRNGSIKMRTLQLIELSFGDCSNYIIKEQKVTTLN